jgi:SAM-dependent methyltransferase
MSLRLASAREERAALRRASAPLAWAERAHLLVRLASVPWDRVLPAFEAEGSLADVGCGPGLLAHLLARAGFRGRYLGLDPDPRKVGRARRWLAEGPARRFEALGVEGAGEGAFSQVALIDVLYLVPPAERSAFLARAVSPLAPRGLFVALTSGGGPRWKRRFDAVQERLAVGLGVTRGRAVSVCDGEEIAALLRGAGLGGVRVTGVGAGYAHGFELVTARRLPA